MVDAIELVVQEVRLVPQPGCQKKRHKQTSDGKGLEGVDDEDYDDDYYHSYCDDCDSDEDETNDDGSDDRFLRCPDRNTPISIVLASRRVQ